MEAELLDSTKRMIEVEAQLNKLQKNLDSILKEKVQYTPCKGLAVPLYVLSFWSFCIWIFLCSLVIWTWAVLSSISRRNVSGNCATAMRSSVGLGVLHILPNIYISVFLFVPYHLLSLLSFALSPCTLCLLGTTRSYRWTAGSVRWVSRVKPCTTDLHYALSVWWTGQQESRHGVRPRWFFFSPLLMHTETHTTSARWPLVISI